MEPNKLEQQMREKLNQREIQPSEMAWDRLDAMLSVAETTKKPKRNWLYVAAAILVFVGLGTAFFNQKGEIQVQESVVVAGEKEKVSEPKTEVVSVQETQIAAIPTSAKAKKIQTKIPTNTPEVNLDETPTAATPANRYIESEQLLAEAETRIQADHIKKYVAKSDIKVDAKSLLNAVDSEVNNSFKERVINSINKNYESMKTSLANRNIE